ncbi:hypothetical protein [Paenibacillus polymyxa]|nr:hypothetical protein [Paenibacillus polymyxa]MDN4106419.1 hypothetical protein [Paenibacillus polymyxa]
MITKASLLALRELQEALSKDAKEQGVSERDVLDELKQVREDLWNERKEK